LDSTPTFSLVSGLPDALANDPNHRRTSAGRPDYLSEPRLRDHEKLVRQWPHRTFVINDVSPL
jgi:hypothetical protein